LTPIVRSDETQLGAVAWHRTRFTGMDALVVI